MSEQLQNNANNIETQFFDINPIYKVNYLVNGLIDTIYVFIGNKIPTEIDEPQLFSKIFTEDETENITTNKIEVVFSEQQIHPDDSIGVIKLKILSQLKHKASLDEIYLFCQKIETLNSVAIYQSLTQNKRIALTQTRLNQFISNIVSDRKKKKFKKPVSKETYDYDDILEMNIDNKSYLVNKPLGMKYFIVENEYPFVANPFVVTEYDSFFEKSLRKTLTTLNSNLLLNTGDIFNNNIFLCLAKDVMEHLTEKSVSETTTIKIYYPFLYNKNINSLETLDDSKQELLETTKQLLTDKTLDVFKTVDMFYDVYKLRNNNLQYISRGIKFIKVVVRPLFTIKLPLEVIFKITHATDTTPLIKYNPSTRQENVFRLYTADNVSTDGRKIPVLKKGTIFKLMKSIGKNKSVSIFIEVTVEDNLFSIICEFDENGYITITSEFNTLVDEKMIDNLFKEAVNPNIQEIKNYLEQSGYKINLFNSLNDENVEVKQLTYEMKIQISKPVNIESFKGCISSVFNNESTDFKSGIHLRFKRVANFNKVTSQEAFIMEKRDQGYSASDIIDALLQNYSDDLNRKQAEELVMKVANEVRVERGVRKSEIKIKDNPGFKTTILLERQTGIISITTDNINDMNYLTTIPIYLDTIIRLTQNKNSTNYPLKEINKLCSSGEKEDVELPDIISPTESRISEFEEPILDENEELTHKKSSDNSESDLDANKTKNALSLFFGDDDDEEEDEVEKGGAPVGSSSSEESIESLPPASSSSTSDKPFKKLPSLSASPESKSKSDLEEEEEEESIPSISAASSSIASDKPLQKLPSLSSSPESLEEDSIESLPPASYSSTSNKPLQKLPSLSSSPESLEEDSIESLPVASSSKDSEQKLSSLPPIVEEDDTFNNQSKESKESSSSEVIIKKKPPTNQEVKPITQLKPSTKNSTPNKDIEESEESSSSEVIIKKKPPTNQEVKPSTQVKPITQLKQPTQVKPTPKNITPKRKPVVESDSESESDDEDEDEENIQLSSVDQQQPALKNIDNMSLRNYFQDKIEELDSPLIVKQKIGNYSIYSKVCQSHQKRQPIILTDNELAKLKKDKNIKNFLRPEDVVKYGSDKNKQFNYICPRYWCLKTNKPLDPKEFKEKMENGKKVLFHPTCGKILPEGEDEVKPGHYVYEFYKPKKSNPNYKRYPGFQTDKHPKGFCLPCCFDKYLTDGRIKANQKCLENPVPEKTINDAAEEKEQDDYIKGPDKFPLNPGRWGYLPVAIQTMLHEVNADCQISKTNTNIKQNHPCLLRHGVEVSEKQSFIACISDAIFFTQNILDKNGKPTGQKAKVLSITEMKERIIKMLTIDNFMKYQNGNLVTDFYDPDKVVDTSKYQDNNELIKKLNLSNEPDKLFFEKIISSFETFIEFLKDNNVIIDHTYLWDLVCKPNKYLFGSSGINLIIFEIPKDDITNNLRLICPSNHYSSEFYEARKPTLILMKEDNYYEPIYQYKINNNKITIAKIFSEAESNLSSTMRAVFKEIIKPFYDSSCKPLPSMPIEYLAKNPIALYTLIQKLDQYEYTILKLVINFNAKVIGLLAQSPANMKGFIPCYPTALSENLKQNLDYVLMTDPTIWNTYDNTVEFLSALEKRSAKKRPEADIPCKPVFKIVEDEMVVGILTETNQFIQLSNPVIEKDIRSKKNLISIKDKNYIVSKNSVPMIQSDVIITTSKKVDDERVDYIKRIKLETNFYNVFRNTIKILLNDYQHSKLREQIETELSKDYIIYYQKLKHVNRLLRELVKDSVQFIGDDNYYKLINEVSTCLVKDGKTCKDTPNLCAVSEGGKCRLILPEKNLITHKQNEEIYYGKIADEIIRFSRIRSFMFKPQSYLSFGNIGYNLRDNEIIMVQSLLTQEYFENLTPAAINKYVHFNSYDEALPIITQPYDNVIPSLNHAIGKNAERTCQKSEKVHITSSFWKKGFPESFKEVVYGKSSYCTFIVMCDLIEKKTGTKLTVNQLKNILFEEYKKYLDRFYQQIIDILIFEGKKTLGDQVKAETLTFSSFIYTDSYFITPFDMWLLVQKYKIPTFFISQTPIKILTNGKYRSFLGYGDITKKEKFVFIVVPGLRPQNVPNFKLIESDKQDVFISLDHVKGECLENINQSFDNKLDIEEFLSNFKRPVVNQQINRPDGDSDDEVVVIRKPAKKIVRKIVVEESPLMEELKPEVEPELVTVKKTKKRKYVNKRGTKKIVPITNKKIVVESDSSD